MPTTAEKPESLDFLDARPSFVGAPDKVIRNGGDAGVGLINGVILAELGVFENEWRGELTEDSFDDLLKLIKSNGDRGLKCAWTHPNASNDGLGNTIARLKNPRIDGRFFRCDLHFLVLATKPSPEHGGTPKAEYLMDFADEAPDLFEMSLRPKKVRRVYREDDEGKRERYPNGELKPPIWRFLSLYACDVVDKGDATHSGFLDIDVDDFLSPRNHNAISLLVTNKLDQIFESADRSQTRNSLTAFVQRYLSNRFEDDENPKEPEMSTQTKSTELKTVDQTAEIQKVVADQLKPVNEALENLSKIVIADHKAGESDRRAASITSLCTIQGKSDLAAGFIADETLTKGDVAIKLLAIFREENPLTPGDKPDESSARATQLGKEWDDTPSLQSLGLSRDEYIKSQLLEEKSDAE